MRNVSLTIILILLIFGCYQLAYGNSEMVREKVASVKELEVASKRLNTQVAALEKSSTDEFSAKKKQLSDTVQNYREAKQEYEQVVAQFSTETATSLLEMQENDLKDIYDVDFLWTIVGNYATEEGINLKFDVVKNTTSASSLNNTSTNYIVCDLKFVITGKYINLTDFIYDIEDDDRLNFEINNFDMEKGESDLKVTLTVREVKINSDNLTDTISSMTTPTPETNNTANNTTNTTNTTNSAKNTTNTTNTTDAIDKYTN